MREFQKLFSTRIGDLAVEFRLDAVAFDRFLDEVVHHAIQVAAEIDSKGLSPDSDVIQRILREQRVPLLKELAAAAARSKRVSTEPSDSYGDLGFDSKFRFILVVARRAEQLMRGAPSRLSLPGVKPTRLAMEEVLRGLINWGYGVLEETAFGSESASALEQLPSVAM